MRFCKNSGHEIHVIVEYGLFNTTTLIRNLIYIRYGIILTQFYINFSRQEYQIDVFYERIVQNLRFSGFILYPLSFFLYSPFNTKFWTKKRTEVGFHIRSLYSPCLLISS